MFTCHRCGSGRVAIAHVVPVDVDGELVAPPYEAWVGWSYCPECCPDHELCVRSDELLAAPPPPGA